MPNGNEDIEDVIEDTEAIIEDTEEIQKRTESMDKKLWMLIALWVLDKIIILLMLWLVK